MLFLKIVILTAAVIYLTGIWGWTAGALFFDAGRRTTWGSLAFLLWTILCLALLLTVKPIWLPILVITLLFCGVVVWWKTLQPSHDRDWDPNFLKLPEMIISGETLTVKNVRNTKYRSLQDFDCCYEDRHYNLEGLCGIDFVLVYWGSEWMSHPMTIFDFGDGQHLCISIEVRYRRGGSYSVLPNFFRQNELMYVVSDERDAILRRTQYGDHQDVYLYRLQLKQDEQKTILEDYIRQVNQICHQPRWYNVITANCTTSIYHQLSNQPKWDWRMLINGKLDRMMYERGTYFQGLPFEELKQACRINQRANLASEGSFSRDLRRGLPGFEQVDSET
ncbi:MAG: DUF4105 domain-containing protein [Planctomycetota bacterium]|nr:DUF4105 domain-containing protein [Planctomycetota bacterium]